ncbi:MAG TPA: glycosyltransferase family 4 protein [Thermoleophilaceae bacterium]|nr:glycosyltransferase family 4 protein [Thermoleophilaceae bacterium]
MRVLAVGNMYPPHHQGGYELVWRDADALMRTRGHEVRVLTTDHLEPGVADPDEPDVLRELRWYWRDHDFPRLPLLERVRIERHNARVLARELAAFGPDVVAFWSMGGMSLSLVERALRAGCPAVCVVHDDWLLYGPEVDAWTRMLERRPLARRFASRVLGMPSGIPHAEVSGWLFGTEFLRQRALAALALEDTAVAYPGIPLEEFRAAPERPWRWRLACVARLDPRKGIDAAIGALRHLPPEASLDVVGPGDPGYRAELEALAGATRREVRFSVLEPARVPELYASADALLFPVRWDEPFGLVPIEAMAVGRPVIATGTGGSAEYLRDGENCLLVPRDDDGTAIAAAVTRLAGDAGLRSALREGGFDTAQRFPREALGEAVADLCGKAVERG